MIESWIVFYSCLMHALVQFCLIFRNFFCACLKGSWYFFLHICSLHVSSLHFCSRYDEKNSLHACFRVIPPFNLILCANPSCTLVPETFPPTTLYDISLYVFSLQSSVPNTTFILCAICPSKLVLWMIPLWPLISAQFLSARFLPVRFLRARFFPAPFALPASPRYT